MSDPKTELAEKQNKSCIHNQLSMQISQSDKEKAKKPIRVCFLIDRLDRAGTESQLLLLIKHLDQSRIKPYLCLLNGEDQISRSLEPDCCSVYRLGVRSLCRPATLLQAFKFMRFLRNEQIDVLQVYFPDSSIFGVFSGWLAGVPRMIRTRNNLGHWMTRKDRWIAKILNRFVHLTIANCEACRQAVIADENVDPESVVILENGIDLERFRNKPRASAQNGKLRIRKVGMVANLRPVKDPETFVRAAALVAAEHPDVQFEIAGEGELRPQLLKLADELGLNGRFRLLGTVDDIPEFLHSLDVAVSTSRSEGMSNAILEYMAAGLPIVATNVGANDELIKNDINGTIIKTDDSHEVAEAISILLSDKSKSFDFAIAGRRRVNEHFCSLDRATRFQTLYELIYGNYKDTSNIVCQIESFDHRDIVLPKTQ